MIYVISDTPKLKNAFVKNPSCFELRSVALPVKKMVITSDNRNVLEYIKHKDDDYLITVISPLLLKRYCKSHNSGIVHVSNCFCDIATRKEICKIDEYHFDDGAAVEDFDGEVVPNFLLR